MIVVCADILVGRHPRSRNIPAESGMSKAWPTNVLWLPESTIMTVLTSPRASLHSAKRSRLDGYTGTRTIHMGSKRHGVLRCKTGFVSPKIPRSELAALDIGTKDLTKLSGQSTRV